jgi:hypothetical protein
MNALPPGVEHLIVQLGDATPLAAFSRSGLNVHTGIPIVYPRLGFLESILSSRFNPIVTLGKARLKGFTNNFNGDVELLDDLVFISFPPRLGFLT